jgi:signal transduction histidine kinase
MISIRWRLTILLCLAMGLLLVATGCGVFMGMRHVLRERFDETLAAKARALITASEIDGGDFEIDLTVQDFAGFGIGGDDYFEVRRTNGALFLSSPSLQTGGLDPAGIGKAKPPRDDGAHLKDGKLGDGRLARFYIQRFYPKDDKKGRHQDLYLIVASPLRGLSIQLALLATVLAVAGGLALFFMVPLIGIGLGRGLRPLDKLAAEVRGIRPEALDQRVATDKLPAELVPVATSLNEWLERLEASFDRERRFSSNAAHELRTPLAELKTMAELGATWPEEATQGRCKEMVAVVDEMGALLEKLSLLARADAGRQPVVKEDVDVEATIAAAISRLQASAGKRKISFETRLLETRISTDPVLWGTILQNLLGNAVAHAPEGSVVKVDCSGGVLSVSNRAPDLRPEDLERLFERFWRKDESRSGYGHSGLGMSIVKACAALLGGHCRATLASGDELKVEVILESSFIRDPAVRSRPLPASGSA